MNERLKQFADQCRGDPMTSAFEPRFDKEKFAELIVRECAEVADNADAIRPKWRSIGKWVREHFGVEE